MTRIHLLLIILSMLIALAQAPANAHAVLVGSTPKDGATVAASPKTIVLRFDAKIEKKVTQVTLLDAKGKQVALPKPPHGYTGGPANQLVIPIPKLRSGAYRLEYQVMATDGHISPGMITFRVAEKSKK